MIDGRINYGINREAAQVIDTRFYTQQILRQREMAEHRTRQDQQEMASMLSRLTPDKLRSADIPEFNEMYNQLKDLYIQNRGLYSRPADHPIEYKKAENLKSRIQQFIADSKEVEKTLGTVGETAFKDPDLLDDSAVGLTKELTTMPTTGIQKRFGRNITLQDFEYAPKEPDYTKIAKEIDGMGMTSEDSIILRGKENGVPEGKIRVRFDKVTDPAAIDLVAESKWNDSNFRKWYTKAFKEVQTQVPGKIEEMQQEINTRFGEGAFEISDPRTFAKADLLLRNQRTPGESKLQDDEQWQRRNKLADDALKYERDLNKINLRDKLSRERAAQNRAASGKANKEDDDKLMIEANDMIEGLKKYSQADEKGKEVAKGKLAPLYKHPKLRDKIGLIEPHKVKDADEFWRIVNGGKNTKNNAGPFRISREDADKAYNAGTPLVRIVLPSGKGKDDDGNTIAVDEVHLINPNHISSAARLYALLKKAGGNRKYGITEDFNNDEGDDD